MNNPNHPLYNALGGNSNIHLLDNMLFTTDQHKSSLIPQYAYPMETLAAHQVSSFVILSCNFDILKSNDCQCIYKVIASPSIVLSLYNQSDFSS